MRLYIFLAKFRDKLMIFVIYDRGYSYDTHSVTGVWVIYSPTLDIIKMLLMVFRIRRSSSSFPPFMMLNGAGTIGLFSLCEQTLYYEDYIHK